MAKVWNATITISLGKLDSDRAKRYPRIFKDPNNPTNAEVKQYFQEYAEDIAGSNDGSEMLANSPIEISVAEE